MYFKLSQELVTIQILSNPIEARQTDLHFPQKAPDTGSKAGIGGKTSRQPARFIWNRLPCPVWQGMIPYEALFAYTLVIIFVITQSSQLSAAASECNFNSSQEIKKKLLRPHASPSKTE